MAVAVAGTVPAALGGLPVAADALTCCLKIRQRRPFGRHKQHVFHAIS
jgi:hypothetical protein